MKTTIPERVEEMQWSQELRQLIGEVAIKLGSEKGQQLADEIRKARTETDQQAREYCNAWIDPQKEMPEHNIQVLCAVQHFTTKRIVYDVLETKECDDVVWFDGDGEIDCWNWNVIGWKHIPTLSNPPSQV